MAKSKSGGTRGLLRGRVASDVYSIGKDASGKSQQVVRSLAETVKNPQTLAQMRGRMIMSTVMQGVSALRYVVDHSFDGFPNGQPCISQFIRENYTLIKADIAAHPASENKFGLNQYQEKGAKAGQWLVANGSAVKPAALTDGSSSTDIAFAISGMGESISLQALADAIGITDRGYATVVAIKADGTASFARISVKTSANLDSSVAAADVLDSIDIEGDLSLTAALAAGVLTLKSTPASAPVASGVIKSVSENGTWHHSKTYLTLRVDTPTYNAAVALPTYPVGSEQFLNGGEL